MGKYTALFFPFTLCMVCFGCKAISTNTVHVDAPYHNARTMAVMRFDDESIQREGIKGLFIKTITNPDAGEALAGIITDELRHWRKYLVLTRSEVKNRISAEDMKEDELVKRHDYITLGKILQVDAVVIGKIYQFGLSNMAIYERGNVSFRADCVDTENGKILWSIETHNSTPYNDEIELAVEVAKESVEKLEKEIK